MNSEGGENEKGEEIMLSCCGLDCSKCEGYLATQADDNEMRASVAKEWSEKIQGGYQG